MRTESIINGKKRDIERVGSEQEYYEETKTSHNLFYGYVVCAGIATIVDLTILYSLTEFFGFWYFNAAVFGYFGGIIINFTLQKYFNFKNYSKKIFSQFGLFLVVALIGLGFNQFIIYALVEFIGFWYILAKLFAIAIVMFWSFYGHKNLTFKKL